MQGSQVRVQTTAIVGSYVPRRCGIATFAKDLRDALSAEIGDRQAFAVAMDDLPQGYEYPSEVRFQIPEHQQEEYRTAADMLNINQVDVTLIQHEYGIYGGDNGCYLLDLIRRLRMPVMATLHTVLQQPNPGQKAVMRDVIRYSDRLVVMTGKAGGILREVYGAPEERIVCIPHGIPDVAFADPVLFKERYGLEGRLVLLTFGLLSPGKGIEVVLRGLPQVVRQHPETTYVVLGATHPSLLRQEGDAYRDSLERMVVDLGLSDHVLFHNRYVSLDELCGYLCATDVYVTPYPNPDQITSGTLAYAMGTGRAVVSTPYWHAQELLADGRGRLVPFNDSDAIAREVNDLLGNADERNALRQRAYAHCRPMIWKEVAKSYLGVARSLIEDRRDRPRPLRASRSKTVLAALPDVNLAHLRRLTDDAGILQHANYSIPDRHHGYSADDNARAIVASLMYYALRRDASILPLVDTYLAFLYHAFDPQRRRFRNYLTFDRQWIQDEGSDDVHGRAMWALGLAAAMAPTEAILSFSTRLFNSGLEALESMGSPRAWSFALVGIHAYLERFSGDTNVRRVRGVLGSRLHERFIRNASADWPWCEDAVTYDNAKIPHAMILCGQWIPDWQMRDQGLRSLGWLVDMQAGSPRHVSLIGNDGWLVRGGDRARFDQQPVEAMALVEACAEAYRCTRDAVWVQRARRFLDWFLGGNDTRSMIYDYQTGGCRDGLHADGPNLNQGAESTLAWLISLLTVLKLEQAVVLTDAAEAPASAPTGPPAAGNPS